MDDSQLQRERMVQRQIAARGVRDPYTLEAMRRIPREEFVAWPLREFAYEDAPLPIEAGQTISQPYIVALMIAEAQVRPGDRVLEIGAGSGYAAAVMAAIAAQVYAIERVPELATLARDRFARLGYDNIEVLTGDGTLGWPDAAPFDAILAAAGGPDVPDVLLRQLAPGGRLVMPIGSSRDNQRLVLVTRTSMNRFVRKELGAVRFVPLIGEHGWRDDTPVTMAAVAEACALDLLFGRDADVDRAADLAWLGGGNSAHRFSGSSGGSSGGARPSVSITVASGARSSGECARSESSCIWTISEPAIPR